MSTYGSETPSYTYPEDSIVPSRKSQSVLFESGEVSDVHDNPSSSIISESDVDINLYNSISRGAKRGRLANLDDFCTRMYEASIPGPFVTMDVHLASQPLGKGAQFQVYGSDNMLADPEVYATVDRPFKAVESDVRGKRRRLVVAIKRPIFDIPTGVMPVNFDLDDEDSTGSRGFTQKPVMGFGTLSQQRNLQLEVFALSHPPLRSHENIVKLIAWGFDAVCDSEWDSSDDIRRTPQRPIFPFLIMEHANCSLANFVRNHDFGEQRGDKTDSKSIPVPLPVLQHLVLDVTRGLQALHTCGIVHADIKPDNVLVFPRENSPPYFCIAKLSDFGLSVTGQIRGAVGTEGGYRGEPTYALGTPGWMAPEFEDGVYPDMLMKTDYFSLGLLLWSVFIKSGMCPIRVSDFEGSGRACQQAILEFETASTFLGYNRSQRFSRLAQLLLPRDPEQRTSDLEEVCALLQEDSDCTFDTSGSWLEGLFEDSTPWDALSQNSNGSTFHLTTFERRKTDIFQIEEAIKDKYADMSRDFETRYAWKNILCLFPTLPTDDFEVITDHYYSMIRRLACLDGVRLNELVGSEISMPDLFSFGFDCRLNRLSHNRCPIGLASAIAAVSGYLPAQAICTSILNIDELAESISPTIIAEVEEKEFEWQQNAVSSGYLLAWGFAVNHPTYFQTALDKFRKDGGYNQHYIHLSNVTKPAAHSVQYSRSGMLYYARGSLGRLPWLRGYPLHRAAALELLDEMVELMDIQGLDVNALDSQGETPLMKAAMAGSVAAVTLLMNHGADHTIRSQQSGAYPLHYLFLFPPDSFAAMGRLLLDGVTCTAEGLTDQGSRQSILQARSNPDLPAFHFPFRWPAATPVGWGVLANNEAAIDVLCRLGSDLDTVDEFFPAPVVINWKAISKPAPDLPSRHLEPYESWVYSRISDYMSSRVMICENWFVGICRLKGNEHRARRTLSNKSETGSPLMKAITSMIRVSDAEIKTHFETTKESENWKPFVNKRSWVNGRLPLQMAALRGRTGLVSMLLEHGAELNFDMPERAQKDSALWSAIEAGQTSVVKILLDAGARIMSPEILEYACRQAPPEIAFLVLEATQNAGINVSSALFAASHRNPCSGDISEANSLEIVNKLLDAGADPNVESPQNGTPLCVAARFGRTRVVRLLLSHGAKPNWSGGPQDSSPLQESIEGAVGDLPGSTILLLDAGANTNVLSGTELATPLQAMAFTGSAAGVKLLLQRGAKVNLSTPVGKYGSALQAAVVKGDVKTVELLTESGADVNALGGQYGCPLKAALALGHVEIISMLRKHGALATEKTQVKEAPSNLLPDEQEITLSSAEAVWAPGKGWTGRYRPQLQRLSGYNNIGSIDQWPWFDAAGVVLAMVLFLLLAFYLYDSPLYPSVNWQAHI